MERGTLDESSDETAPSAETIAAAEFMLDVLDAACIRRTDELIDLARLRFSLGRGVDKEHRRYDRHVVAQTLSLVAARLFDGTAAEVASRQRKLPDGRREATFTIRCAERTVAPRGSRYQVGRPTNDPA